MSQSEHSEIPVREAEPEDDPVLIACDPDAPDGNACVFFLGGSEGIMHLREMLPPEQRIAFTPHRHWDEAADKFPPLMLIVTTERERTMMEMFLRSKGCDMPDHWQASNFGQVRRLQVRYGRQFGLTEPLVTFRMRDITIPEFRT